MENRKEYMRLWRQKNKEKIKEDRKRYYQEHKEEINSKRKNDEEFLSKKRIAQKKYRDKNRKKINESKRKYYHENKAELLGKQLEYCKTRKGRANYLINSYKRDDKNYNRGECTLTTQWILENIFTKPCHYCGESDWNKLGCDRIDNDLPHTPENCVPCCYACNCKKGSKKYEEYIKLI